jgi:hypothetical protein
LKASLIDNEQLARKNEGLMTLRHDAPIEVDLTNLAVTPNASEVARLFDFLEFKSMHNRFRDVLQLLGHSAAIDTFVAVTEVVETQVLHAEVTTARTADEVVALLMTDRLFNIAAQWSGEPGRSDLVGLGISDDV